MAHEVFTKPERGAFRRERHAKVAARESYRAANKRRAKTRDGHKCRWPHVCVPGDPLESAHLVNLSQGGGDETSNLITLCQRVHTGAVSLHSGDLRIDPVTSAGADGPCSFLRRTESGRWEVIATERVIGLSETRT